MKNSKKTLEFKFERTIPAPPGEVFDAWLDPKIPGNPWHEADKLIFRSESGRALLLAHQRDVPITGDLRRSSDRARIQHTWMSPNTLGEESTVTVTFKKKGDDTLMTLVHSGLPDD